MAAQQPASCFDPRLLWRGGWEGRWTIDPAGRWVPVVTAPVPWPHGIPAVVEDSPLTRAVGWYLRAAGETP